MVWLWSTESRDGKINSFKCFWLKPNLVVSQTEQITIIFDIFLVEKKTHTKKNPFNAFLFIERQVKVWGHSWIYCTLF